MTRTHKRDPMVSFALFVFLFCFQATLKAQSVEPVISEYKDHASGSFEVTNTTLTPMAVVLEPKSFSIDEEGKGAFRALDPGILLQLSATSMRLEPHQSATVFYKVAAADAAPAWLSIYASFSALHPSPGLNVKIMLPHTIYLYQHEALAGEALHLDRMTLDPELHRLSFVLSNRSTRAGRVEAVRVSGHHVSAEASGFPLLPHQTRRFDVPWTNPSVPELLTMDLHETSVKIPLAGLQDQP